MQTVDHLKLFFKETKPEKVLASIKDRNKQSDKKSERVDAVRYSETDYRNAAKVLAPELTGDEVHARYLMMQAKLCKYKEAGMNIFGFLCDFADSVLTLQNNEPVCRLENIRDWNGAFSAIGQDLLITAWLAKKDINDGVEGRHDYTFTWPAVIKTDEYELNELFGRGLAENHFHLQGSAQNFPLSWACLMNHPEDARESFTVKGRFISNLSLSRQASADDIMMTWTERIQEAAAIRALLFEKCLKLGRHDAADEFLRIVQSVRRMEEINGNIQVLVKSDGSFFEQPAGYPTCLDYAVSRHLYEVKANYPNRLLTGERAFLYHCFCMQFKGELSERESSLLYLYILLKNAFRNEIIQNNGAPGFDNFKRYQDRKRQFFSNREEYNNELYRLAIVGNINDNHIKSLEARIMPAPDSATMKKRISSIDDAASYASDDMNGQVGKKDPDPQGVWGYPPDTKKQNIKDSFFYTVHFPKSKLVISPSAVKYIRNFGIEPRNFVTRKNSKKGAKALEDYLRISAGEPKRVFGIDACSNEIGCRPETFAPVYRCIRGNSQKRVPDVFYKDQNSSSQYVGMTYHVGEDFMDIIDGLRAVDEVLIFLEFQKGDRLGHGIVLGVDADRYYRVRNYEVVLPKQDLLDNLVWMKHKALENGIPLSGDALQKINDRTWRLFTEIYENTLREKYGDISGSLTDFYNSYYDSWKLRGDDPCLYFGGKFDEKNTSCSCLEDSKYLVGRPEFSSIRNNISAETLYYVYHYSDEVKKAGQEYESYKIIPEYVELAKKLQVCMRREVANKKIAIECNPTSNVRIGAIRSYEDHPLTIFNSHILESDPQENPIKVSINTDDLGVFDTGLEHEYAVMYDAIVRKRHAACKYDDEKVLSYLEYIRRAGFAMSFRQPDRLK